LHFHNWRGWKSRREFRCWICEAGHIFILQRAAEREVLLLAESKLVLILLYAGANKVLNANARA
jgi:hypothetical protein